MLSRTPIPRPPTPWAQISGDMSSPTASMSSKGNGVNITLSPSERPNDDDTQDAEADEHVQICGTREIPKVYEEVLMVFEKHIPPAKLADYKKHWFCDALWFLFGTEVTPPVSQSFAEAHASRQLWFWLKDRYPTSASCPVVKNNLPPRHSEPFFEDYLLYWTERKALASESMNGAVNDAKDMTSPHKMALSRMKDTKLPRGKDWSPAFLAMNETENKLDRYNRQVKALQDELVKKASLEDDIEGQKKKIEEQKKKIEGQKKTIEEKKTTIDSQDHELRELEDMIQKLEDVMTCLEETCGSQNQKIQEQDLATRQANSRIQELQDKVDALERDRKVWNEEKASRQQQIQEAVNAAKEEEKDFFRALKRKLDMVLGETPEEATKRVKTDGKVDGSR